MFKNNKIMKKLGAGLTAGLCAFTMLGSNFGGLISARAESVTTTENEAFPTADEVIAQAATLLGSPYSFGFKGYTGVYYQDSYKPLELDYVRNQGVDCSGLVYYTLTHLGYKTSGFSWNNPVPVDTTHWISVNDSCIISYGGVTSKVDVEKKQISTEERPSKSIKPLKMALLLTENSRCLGLRTAKPILKLQRQIKMVLQHSPV